MSIIITYAEIHEYHCVDLFCEVLFQKDGCGGEVRRGGGVPLCQDRLYNSLSCDESLPNMTI